MGMELFRQLVVLLQRFRGDAKEACRYWGNLVAAIQLANIHEEEIGGVHPFNLIHAFDDVEKALQSTSPLCVCEDDGLDVWIEFVWTLDLDAGMLTMTAHGGQAEWSFAHIYRGRALEGIWVLEAEAAARQDENSEVGLMESTKKPFTEAVASAAAVQIQASVRRFLEVSRGLRPGGVLVQLAAMRFYRASAILDATSVKTSVAMIR